MTKHHMHLFAPFEKVASGTKRIEFRVYDKKRRLVKVGDEIEFSNKEETKTIRVRVTEIKTFKTVEEMAASLTDEELALNDRTREEWIKGWDDYYSQEEIRQNGLIAIYFQLII